MPLFKDLISKVKIGDIVLDGQTYKPLFPKQLKLNPKEDIVKLPKECFSIKSSIASQAIANTRRPLKMDCKYSFPISSEPINAKDVVMWN